MSEKTEHTVELKDRQFEYVQRMTEKYGLPDDSKTLRILIDYVMHEAIHEPADEERIFTQIRCSDC